jgi:hypothetical protein
MAEQSGERPGHDQLRDEHINERQIGTGPVFAFGHFFRRHSGRSRPDLAERHVPGGPGEPSDDGGDHDGEIVHRGECHYFLPDLLLP